MSGRYSHCDDTCTVDCGHCKGAGPPSRVPLDAERPDLPKITDGVLDQWKESATVDEEAGRMWSVNPIAVLAVVAEVRALREDAEYWQRIATQAKDQRDRAERARDEARGWHNDALIQRDEALAEVARLESDNTRLRDVVDRQLGDCTGCTTEPEETCPRDGRSYMEWVQIASGVIGRENELRERIEGQANTISALRVVARHAGSVMETLQAHGPSIVGHLLDTDDNSGEYLRQALRAVSLGDDPEPDECEREDCQRIAATASDVYCHVTGGKLSYPTYDAQTIITEYEDDVTRLVAEETAEITADRDSLAAKVARVEALCAKAAPCHVWPDCDDHRLVTVADLRRALAALPDPEDER